MKHLIFVLLLLPTFSFAQNSEIPVLTESGIRALSQEYLILSVNRSGEAGRFRTYVVTGEFETFKWLGGYTPVNYILSLKDKTGKEQALDNSIPTKEFYLMFVLNKFHECGYEIFDIEEIPGISGNVNMKIILRKWR